MYELKEKEYDKLKDLIYRESGINLGSAKREMLKARLGKRLRALNLDCFTKYYKYVTKENPGELVNLIDRVSTNKTSFFREPKHFDFLRNTVLQKKIIESKKHLNTVNLRIWSSACSSGEEPYSIIMSIMDAMPPGVNLNLKILGTDISTEILAKAKKGVYEEQKHMDDLNPELLRKYFKKGKGEMEGHIRVKNEFIQKVTFRHFNLLIDNYPFNKKFDVIFCRNVMIYFDAHTREKIINNMYNYVEKGGYLFLGHSESLTGVTSPFKYVAPTIYINK